MLRSTSDLYLSRAKEKEKGQYHHCTTQTGVSVLHLVTTLSPPGLTHPSTTGDGLLLDLLDRMLQVEKPCSRLITSSPKDGTLTEPITPARHDLGSHRSSPSLASTRYPGAEPAIPSAWPKRDIDSVPEEPEARSTANCTAKPLNAEARLKHALDKVLHLKRENLEEQTATLDYRVPPEISKACLDSRALPFNF